MYERAENGVVMRWDGGGDAFANAHRTKTWRDCYMNDLDGIMGVEVYGMDGGDRVFVEYAVKDAELRGRTVHDVAVVAIIDRKRSVGAMNNSARSKGFLCGLCRLIGCGQPYRPLFFYAVGGQAGPWYLYAVDTDTEEIGAASATILPSDSWRSAWGELGLRQLRDELNRWLAVRHG